MGQATHGEISGWGPPSARGDLLVEAMLIGRLPFPRNRRFYPAAPTLGAAIEVGRHHDIDKMPDPTDWGWYERQVTTPAYAQAPPELHWTLKRAEGFSPARSVRLPHPSHSCPRQLQQRHHSAVTIPLSGPNMGNAEMHGALSLAAALRHTANSRSIGSSTI